MPLIQTDSQHYSDIADAIRDMSGNEETFYPSEMAAGVRSIPQTIAIQPIIYSLEEREVGVWTDGRPLYQKSYHYTGSLGSDSHVTLDSSMEQANTPYIGLVGICFVSTSISATAKMTQSTRLPYDVVLSGGDNLYFHNKSNYTIYEFYLTVQYTKTTDTPGSGTWTPSGVPAHHYSTEEQVIGTWTNRKPIYEKTYILNKTMGEISTSLLSDLNISACLDIYFLTWHGNLWKKFQSSYNNNTKLIVDKPENWMYIYCLVVQYTKSTD